MREYTSKSGNRFFNRIHYSISIAIALSVVLIVAGIWNSRRTASVAESSIHTSIESRQISDALRVHQDAMNSAVEFAISNDQIEWRNNYEDSLNSLQEALYSASLTIDDPVIENMRHMLSSVVIQEREIFRLIADDHIDTAFELLASVKYQEQKIEQEQLAFTLRAILDKNSSDVVDSLRGRLHQTTFALFLQIFLIAIIWYYIIRVVRQWQNEQTRHSDELTRIAHSDSLTGIGNRTLFHIRLEIAFKQSQQSGKPVALMLMDVDHFKDINDTLGHDVGDKLLEHIAGELQRCCRDTDTVVRLGGDEFAIIAAGIDEKRDTAVLGQKILAIFEHPIQIKDHQIQTGTSIGFSFYPDDATSSEELLRKADMALYEAKRNGRAQFQLFDKRIEKQARYRREIQEDLRNAINNEEFLLFYQPIVDLQTEQIVGVESLLRWQHPEHGLLSPDRFIEIAEHSRLIIPIGDWVMKKACAQQVEWVEKGLPPINMSINLSALQFYQRDLHEKIQQIIRETGISNHHLTLEITESTLMETAGELISYLNELNELGIKLVIDDFGTGYSSLAYLKRFPIQQLKIDREFIKDVPNDAQDVAIARSIIKMAHELGILVVAEGIEGKRQKDFLREAKCNFGQGYYFGRPVLAEELEQKMISNMAAHTNVTRIAR